MSDSYYWLKRTPQWVWLSFIPTFGGLAITYAGNKAKKRAWFWLGLGLTGIGLILSSTNLSQLSILVWLAQIGTAFSLKKPFLIKTAPKGVPIPDAEIAQLMAESKGKIDINSCSKDDLVYTLGLPIIYANNIEILSNEGYIFTHIEELSDLADIPEDYLKKIAPLITFSYNINKEIEVSWRRLNTASLDELVMLDIKAEVAQKIIAERKARGAYKSLIEVRNRTGISISEYRHLI